MGSLILCHKKRARQPYVISRVHMKIYTIEELCYYICNNLYLIDYTIINQQLCDWIGRNWIWKNCRNICGRSCGRTAPWSSLS